MRRVGVTIVALSIVGVGIAALFLTGATSAAADKKAQVSLVSVPADLDGKTVSCATGKHMTSGLSHVAGPETTPVGTGSLQIAQSHSSSWLSRDWTTADSNNALPLLSTVSAFRASVYTPSPGGLTPTLTFQVLDGAHFYSLTLSTEIMGQWVALNAASSDLQWFDENLAPAAGSGGTLADFVRAHPQARLQALVVSAGETCKQGSIYVDDFAYSVGGVGTVTDFEN